MENGPFTDDFPNKTSIYNGFSIAMLNYQRVFPMMLCQSYPTAPEAHPGLVRTRLGGTGDSQAQRGVQGPLCGRDHRCLLT